MKIERHRVSQVEIFNKKSQISLPILQPNMAMCVCVFEKLVELVQNKTWLQADY